MDNHDEALDPNKNYSAQEVKDMLDALKAKHEQDSIERINKLMESEITELLDKRLLVNQDHHLPGPPPRHNPARSRAA
jgi:hypothetical protein